MRDFLEIKIKSEVLNPEQKEQLDGFVKYSEFFGMTIGRMMEYLFD